MVAATLRCVLSVFLVNSLRSFKDDQQTFLKQLMERSIGKIWANKIVYLVVLLVPLIAGLALIYAVKIRKSQTRMKPFENITITRVTSEDNIETAAISPDGTQVAYTLEENGKRSLWTKSIDTGNRVQLVSPQESLAMSVSTFSSAGDVYYSLSDQSNPHGTLFQISAQGGSPEKLLASVSTPVALSHDGRYLAYVRRMNGTKEELFVANADGSNERLLLSVDQPNWLGNSSPTWSPDDSILAIAYGSEDRNESTGRNLGMTPILISVTDGKLKPLARSRWLEIDRISWLNDGSGLLFVARQQTLGPRQLWQIAYPRGESRQITNDLNSYDGDSLTQTTDARVLLVESNAVSNIWVATLGQSGSEKAVTTLKSVSEGSRGLTWTVDGRIVFDANVNGRAGLWSVNADGGDPTALINAETEDLAPETSKDGRQLVFGSYRTGRLQVWQASLDGSNQRKLTSESGGVANFSLSRDGRWVIYTPLSGGIRKVSTEGGQSTELSSKGNLGYPQLSPDGKLVAYFFNDPQSLKPKIAVVNFDAAALAKTIDLPATSQPDAHDCLFYRGWHWSPDGQNIVYINTVNNVSNLWSQAIDNGTARQITDFKSERILTFAFSPDGRHVAVARTRSANNAVLLASGK